MMTATQLNGRLVGSRLENLPTQRPIVVIAIVCGLAWMIESFDIGVAGVALLPLQKDLGLSSVERGIFAGKLRTT
jgi:hypothetical protein